MDEQELRDWIVNNLVLSTSVERNHRGEKDRIRIRLSLMEGVTIDWIDIMGYELEEVGNG